MNFLNKNLHFNGQNNLESSFSGYQKSTYMQSVRQRIFQFSDKVLTVHKCLKDNSIYI